MLVVLLVACVFLTSSPTSTQAQNKFVGWWELGGFYGTDDSSRGEIVLFTPLMQSATTLFFLDARGKLFEEDVQEANLALGYRQMLPSGWNLGLWAGWDIRDTEEDNRFHQVSFGLEALSERFDVRVNGYVPVTDPKASPGLAEVFLRGNNILMVGGEEVPLYGVDGEVGMLLFGRSRGGGGGLKGAPARAKRHELRAYAGGFWFDDDDATEEVAGPKGRLEYRINDIVSSLPGSRLTIESELSYDEVRDTRFEIGARLRIPFGARGSDAALRTASLTPQELRMIEGLERDTDIITVESKEESVIDNATNVAMNAVSFANNANQFANAVNKGGNRLIILQRNGAQIDVSATEGQSVKNNQTVQGGASTILMRGARTGTVTGFKAPGSRPTLFSGDGNALRGVVTVDGNNTHLAGLNIRGAGGRTIAVAGNHGVRGIDGLNNVVLEQLDVRNLGDEGIKFRDGNSNIRVTHSNIENISDAGVFFDDNNRNLAVYGTTFTRVGEGVDIQSDNRNITIDHVRVADTGTIAIDFRDDNRNVWIANTRVTNAGSRGIDFDDGNRDVTITDTTIRNSGGDGIEFEDDSRNIKIAYTTISGAVTRGIQIDNNNSNIAIYHVTISNVAGEGIDIQSDNTNITIDHTTLSNITSFGIDFRNDNKNVHITNTKLRDIGFRAIDFDNRNSAKIANVSIRNADGDGLEMAADNVISMENVRFSGTFGQDVIDIDAAGNTLSGDGNVFNGTLIGAGVFCNVTGAQTGQFLFPDGPQNCPP